MEIAIKHPTRTKNISESKSLSISEKFSNLCASLEDYRILLLSAMILIQGAIIVPFTILVTSFIDLGLGGLTIGVLVAGTVGVLVSNLSEISIKAILAIFMLSATSSLALIILHLLSLK